MGNPPASPGSLRRLFDVAGAVLAALLAFTAVPAVLIAVVGDPLSGGLGHAWSPLARDALTLLALAAWVAWAACCLQLLRAVVGQVRRGDVSLRGASVMDQVAARIAVGVLALSSIGGPLAVSSVAGASSPTAVTTSAHDVVANRSDAHATAASHTVRPGETLWGIAHDRLGDGADWTALAAMNLGRVMGDGATFVDPDHLEAGWRLDLGRLTDQPSPHAHAYAHRHHQRGTPPQPGHPDHLPELVALGLGSLACAGLARRTGRRHRSEPFSGELDVSDEAVDAATLLQRFDGVPALVAFEAANRLLGGALLDRARPPRVRAVCVSPAGVSFWFAEAPPAPPPPFTEAADDGHAWQVDHARLDERASTLYPPYAPIALPMGDDQLGTWLVVLGPGQVLPLLGEDAPALARSARARAARVVVGGHGARDGRPGRPRPPRRGRGRSPAGAPTPLLRRSPLPGRRGGGADRGRQHRRGVRVSTSASWWTDTARPCTRWGAWSGRTSSPREPPTLSRNWWRSAHSSGPTSHLVTRPAPFPVRHATATRWYRASSTYAFSP